MKWQYRIVKRNLSPAYGYQFKAASGIMKFLDTWSTPRFMYDSEELVRKYVQDNIKRDREIEEAKKGKIEIIEEFKP